MKFATFTKEERIHVDVITARVRKIAADHYGYSVDRLGVQMDLAAVHLHTPLRLSGLANAEDHDLMHDVNGIARHLNRETGKLENFFVPRYAAV